MGLVGGGWRQTILLSEILCEGQSSGAKVWRCDWLRKGEMKTTVNF